MKRFAMLFLESKARRFGVWLLCGCAAAGCEEKARTPMGDAATTDASSFGDPSESLGPPPDLTAGSTTTGDVAPQPIACGQAAGNICGETTDSIAGLEELAALSGCAVYRGSVYLAGVDTTADLWPLSALQEVGGRLGIDDRSELETLEGLECLEQVGDLHILGPPSLRDVSSLRNARLSGELLVSGTTELASLDGLQTFSAARAVGILENMQLADLEGLSGLERVEVEVLLYRNPLLTDVEGLRNLVDFEGALAIERSGKLRTLEGLEQIHTLSSLTLLENPVLESLDGLAGLEHVTGDVELRDNAMLSTEEIDELLAHVVVDGEVIVE